METLPVFWVGAASVAATLIVCVPGEVLLTDQFTWQVAAVVPRLNVHTLSEIDVVPKTSNISIFFTPLVSLAVAETFTVPLRIAPFAGEVIVMAGGVVSANVVALAFADWLETFSLASYAATV